MFVLIVGFEKNIENCSFRLLALKKHRKWFVLIFTAFAQVYLAPFNNLKSIEKDLADVLLLWSSTLALGLVEEVIWVWAPELASLRV